MQARTVRPNEAAIVAVAIAVSLATGPTSLAQQQAAAPEVKKAPEEKAATDDTADLQKAVQNPVSDLVSVPFQNNLDYGIGPNERARNTLNIQPVVPVLLTEKWNLIVRTIVPIVWQPILDQQSGDISGLGDINPTFFFSPAHPGKLIWGLGPAFLLPTATQASLGTGKWSVGPSAVLLAQPKPWTLGVLASNLWSFAGQSGRPDVNQLMVQYFINYNLSRGVYLTSAPIITANWEAASGDQWTVPVGAGIGKIFRLGKLPLNGQVDGYWNAVTPDQTPSPDWQLRVQLAFLFPTEKK